MSKVLVRLLPLLLVVLFYSSPAGAQQPDRPPSLKMGDAVVTGFSGTIAPDAAKKRPRNQSANDLTFINPDGPSVRIVDVSKPGYVWDGRLFQAPKTFDVLAKDIGQVFGVALDDQTPPNIYVAATSVFGLNIVSRGRDGSAERKTKGGPGAGWMKGQFGLDLQGGPGGIYKIDGRTGVASLFANVTLDGVPNPGPGLGNLAYDSAHKQLFVSDLYTGMIHRFDLDGKELSRYDHGVTGLGAAKLATVAFNPKDRPNIANARFDSEKPATWGFAPAARRTWGLAVHDGRLYYAVVAGPQIWSVGIEGDGNFAADPRWELDVPAQAGPLPVSDIAFTQSGAMILAQRALIAGAYDYYTFTQPGEPQVLRFWLKAPNDPPSPGRWKLIPEEFAVGFAGNYRNSNGGVALGYGYGSDGTLSAGSCEAALWTTGQNLRNNPALRSQLEPGGPLVVHGLQGSPADMLRHANEPQTTSYFVDYDDKFDDPRASGHIGSVRIFTQPCAGAIASRPVAPVIATFIGTSSRPQACTPTCICPPGTVLEGKECVKRDCPDPQVFNPATGSCVCPQGMVLENGKCVRVQTLIPPHECRPPLVLDPLTGLCVSPKHECVPPLVLDPVTGSCVCPNGGVLVDGKCVPQICPSPLVPGPCECPDGTVRDGQLCLPTTPVDVGIVKTGGTTPYCPAPFYVFTITVTNGPNPWPATGNIVVSDTVPANITFGPIASPPWTCLPAGVLPAGTPFTCTYNGPALTANQVLPVITIPATPTVGPPFPPYVNCASVAITSSSGFVDTNPANNNFCTPPVMKPAACTCPPPQVMNVDGICACPQGQVLVGGACVPISPVCPLPQVPNADGICACPAPMQPGAVPGQCICPLPNVMVNGVCVLPPPVCPQGQVLVGGACVPTPPVCTAPQVPNVDGICACPAPMQPGPTPGSCKCPEGMTLVGGACVTPPPPVRKQPDKVKKPQACPEGTIKQGSKCVKRERKGVTGDDVRRGIDIIRGIPGSSGGGGGRDRGSPGTR